MTRPTLTMFHFRCAACGATPGEVPLRSYLRPWLADDGTRLTGLLAVVGGALHEVALARTAWLTKRFRRFAGKAVAAIELVTAGRELRSHLIRVGRRDLRFNVECPMCEAAPGRRTGDSYFTGWADACKVQTGNLLYETGLVLWTAQRSPAWRTDAASKLEPIRQVLRACGLAMPLPECPQCGRFTTTLGGGTTPAEDYCRWCSDAAGAGPTIRITVQRDVDGDLVLDPLGKLRVRISEPAPLVPSRDAWDCLPPEVTSRWTDSEAEDSEPIH